jgi:hypothetical protein
MFQKKNFEKITHFMFNNFFLENPTVYEIRWKSTVETDGPHMTIWRMRIAYWITRAINTHLEYVIIIAFPLQQWLRERASMLPSTHIACPVGAAYRMHSASHSVSTD